MSIFSIFIEALRKLVIVNDEKIKAIRMLLNCPFVQWKANDTVHSGSFIFKEQNLALKSFKIARSLI